MRAIGLDVHRDFCEVAIAEDGEVRSAGPGRDAARRRWSCSRRAWARDDRVALEVTGNAWEIARIIEPHVARVVVVRPSDTGIRQARAKTDRLDARTLAQAAGGRVSWTAVWMPDERTPGDAPAAGAARAVGARRARARRTRSTRCLIRRLKGRPPMSAICSAVKGRRVAGRARAADRGARDARQRPAPDRLPRHRDRAGRAADRARRAQLARGRAG